MIIDWENIVVYWEESERSEALTNECGLYQKELVGVWVVAAAQPQEIAAIFTLILAWKQCFQNLNCHKIVT